MPGLVLDKPRHDIDEASSASLAARRCARGL